MEYQSKIERKKKTQTHTHCIRHWMHMIFRCFFSVDFFFCEPTKSHLSRVYIFVNRTHNGTHTKYDYSFKWLCALFIGRCWRCDFSRDQNGSFWLRVLTTKPHYTTSHNTNIRCCLCAFFRSVHENTEKLSTNIRGYNARICGFHSNSPLIGINNVISSNRNEREMKQQQGGFGQNSSSIECEMYAYIETENAIENYSQKIYNQNSSEQHHRRPTRPQHMLSSLFVLSSVHSVHLICLAVLLQTKHVVPCSVQFYCLHLCVACCRFV